MWSCILTVVYLWPLVSATIPPTPSISIQKCCGDVELLIESSCGSLNGTKESAWKPVFIDEDGRHIIVNNYKLLVGVPSCGNRDPWPIYHNGSDRLRLLPDGSLRHFVVEDPELGDDELTRLHRFYDYHPGIYCIDKQYDTHTKQASQFALVCAPEIVEAWRDTDFVLRKIVDPILHVAAIICYVSVAIIHFVLPQLRDLVGNIITTMCLCLAVGQAADLVRIFTHFTTHPGYLSADIIMFVCLLAAFFWLTSMGFYIWKTFRSRNVFLRITDGRKYLYYMLSVWSCTILMAALAVFAHFTLDQPVDQSPTAEPNQAPTFGWLGIAILVSALAYSILMDVYFFVSTTRILRRMSTYGRIHHKLKFCFQTYLKLLCVMTISWLFLLISWLPYAGMYYCYILSNAVEAPLILYLSVLSQRRVRYLLKRACCYDNCICTCCRPVHSNEGPEWGEEMIAMNR